MIEIHRLTEAHIESVKKVRLLEEQIQFSSTAEDFLSDETESTHLHVIQWNKITVGFFKLDLNYTSNYDFCPNNTIGLRKFAIDKDQQGKGLGKQSIKALFTYLKEHYPTYQFLYLTVNTRNSGAATCYEKSGFEYTNEMYLGGDFGPQHVMRKQITA